MTVAAVALHRLERQRRTAVTVGQCRRVDVDRHQVVIVPTAVVTGQVAIEDIDEGIGLSQRPGGVDEIRDLPHLVVPGPVQGLLQQFTRVER